MRRLSLLTSLFFAAASLSDKQEGVCMSAAVLSDELLCAARQNTATGRSGGHEGV